MQEHTILIVDDDREICTMLSDFLQKHNYRVYTAHNSKQMNNILQRHKIDLLVLDIMLPGDDGLEICRKLRKKSAIPIIMASALGDETERIIGLEIGADDYLPKPFNPRELIARIKSLLRRAHGHLHTAIATKKLKSIPNIKFANWLLNRNKCCLVNADGLTIPLSSGEYNLLLAFIDNPHRTLTRDQLMDITHGRETAPFDRAIDVQVGRLRKKIEKNSKKPKIIITVRGGGYQFTADIEVTTDES